MTTPTTRATAQEAEQLDQVLRRLRLSGAAQQMAQRLSQAGHPEAVGTVLEVLLQEEQEQQQRRVARLVQAAKLPVGKTLGTLDQQRLPKGLQQKLKELGTGAFVKDATNVLCFGLPGGGKTHCASALGYALCQAGHSVLFTPTYRLVQELLAAKQALELPKALRKLDAFELVILDDLGYVQQSAEEAEVLFTLLAERYERRSVLVTSNLVFSQWDKIFKNPLTTMAAVDRLVHHSVILNFDVQSYRRQKGAAAAASSPDAKEAP